MAAVSIADSPRRAITAAYTDLDRLEDGLRLRIFDEIEDGLGVVPITGNDAGSHMLCHGEVAVYDARWREVLCSEGFQLTPGLYCYERQRPPSSMPSWMVAQRFAANDPVTMVVDRQVVMVFRHPRSPEHWAYQELRHRVHRGVRLTARTEGPIYEHGILGMLLGPIVGIYRPRIEGVA